MRTKRARTKKAIGADQVDYMERRATSLTGSEEDSTGASATKSATKRRDGS